MAAIDQPASETTAAAYRRGVMLVFLAGIFWSTQGVAIRMMEEATAWQILFYRSIALSVFLFLVLAIRGRGNPFPIFKALGFSAVLGGGCLVFAFAGGMVAVKETTVANAFFVFASTPFFAALLGRLLLGEAVRKATWFAIAFALAGIFIMVIGKLDSGKMIGNIASLLAALGFALFTVFLRWKRLSDTLPIVCYGGILATVVGAVAVHLDGSGFAVPQLDLGLCFAMGVGQVGMGLLVFTIGSRHVPAGELALLSMIEAVLGPLWVYLAVGETMSTETAIGGVMIFSAIAFNALSGMRKRPPPPVIP